MGKTTAYLKLRSATPIISTTAYAKDDQLGSVMTIERALRHENDHSVLQSMSVIDRSGQGIVLDVLIFSRTPTVPGDNAPFTLAAGDGDNYVGAVRIDSYIKAGSLALATVAPLDIICRGFDENIRTVDMYAVMVIRDIATYSTTTDLTVRFGLVQA